MDQPYRIVHETTVAGTIQYSADGPGLGYDKPWFDNEDLAATLCRNLAQAHHAGKKARSDEFLKLLEEGRQ